MFINHVFEWVRRRPRTGRNYTDRVKPTQPCAQICPVSKNKSSEYFVYIAELGDGRLYIGITNNVDRRALEHQRGKSIRTTRIFGFRRILYKESHPTLLSARKREQQLKRWSRVKKLALAKSDFPTLKRLSRSRRSSGPRATS